MISPIQNPKLWFIISVLANTANALIGAGNQRKPIYYCDVISSQSRSSIRNNVNVVQTAHNPKSHSPPSSESATESPTPSTTTDWKAYALQQKYKKAGRMLYKQSILSPREYSIIQRELKSTFNNLKMKEENESSFATNRVGATISEDSDVWRVLSCEEGSLCRLINCLADGDGNDGDEKDTGKMILAPDIPIEVCETKKCLTVILQYSRESSLDPVSSHSLYHIFAYSY